MPKNPLENVRTVLLDIDGTLIDSNDAHANAWVDALAEFGIQIPYEDIRNKIGMGGDHLLPLVTGIKEDSEQGKKISNRRGEIFREKYLKTLKALPGARELLECFQEKGIEVIVATSASKEDLEKLLKQARIDDLLKTKTSSDDADSSKPSPDIIEAALQKTKSPREHVRMIGDTPYDLKAAQKAGVQSIGFASGGWAQEDMHPCVAFFAGPRDLYEAFGERGSL